MNLFMRGCQTFDMGIGPTRPNTSTAMMSYTAESSKAQVKLI